MNIADPTRTLSICEGLARGSSFRPPLVSVIIVNYNYGRFLRQAVDSVFGQTYPNLECIIVDNASTDETPEVLRSISDRYPQTTVVRRAHNDGQTAASLDGLDAASGAYVILMDADDVLLPQGVETHIAAHLSLRVHVGFTSGDMLQAVDDQIVVGTSAELNRYIRRRKRRRNDIVRPYRDWLNADWPPESLTESVADRIYLVPPLTTRWIWSPTSGLCYRRDALRLFADNPALANLRTGTDIYFARAIGGLCGAAIIDVPVFVYRVHGNNIFSRQPQLNRVLAFEPGGAGDNNSNAKLLLVDHMTEKAQRFCQNRWLSLNYAALLWRLDCADPDPDLPRWRRRSRVAARLVDHYDSVASALGPPWTKLLMVRFGVPPRIIWEK